MNEAPIEALKEAVEQLHECNARHRGTEHITETFEGETVWDGDVHIFALEGHPKASTAYAWSSPTEEGRRRFFAILKIPPVVSPQDAVRASIVQGLRESDNPS